MTLQTETLDHTLEQPIDTTNMPSSVEIIDCTLRDGEQAPGVWFTPREKLLLAESLSDAGVNLLDAGFPGASGSDLEAMQEMRHRNLRCRIGATARPLPNDIAAAELARAEEVFLFMPTSDRRLRETLGLERDQALRAFLDGSENVASRGMVLNLVLEDATRSDVELMTTFIERISRRVSIKLVVMCDTVGSTYPSAFEKLTARLVGSFSPEIQLCTHCHNDFGLATANTLAAVTAGASAVTCTVNGIGERAGNADLAEVVAALTHIHKIEHSVDPCKLTELSRTVERFSGIYTSAIKPVTGFNVYRHESGIHVDGMMKDNESYEFLPAAWVGRIPEYVLGKHSGTSIILQLLGKAKATVDDDQVKDILFSVKNHAEHRSKDLHDRLFEEISKARQNVLSGVHPGLVQEIFSRRNKAHSD